MHVGIEKMERKSDGATERVKMKAQGTENEYEGDGRKKR
jgi:hypothetical protein